MAKKILIIDDEMMTNTLVNFLMRSGGFETVTAQDGIEGLVKAEQETPDLIILDISMPRMDGFTFLEELKKMKGQAMPLVIVLTGKERMQELFRGEGIADYFVKPIDSEKLIQRVQELLG